MLSSKVVATIALLAIVTTTTAVTIAAISAAAPAVSVAEQGPLDITNFSEYVANPDTDMEDWQPAFQQALELVRDGGRRPIYVPAGEYKIRSAISIVPRNGMRICGDGPYLSIISQEVESENCIDWTGSKRGHAAYHGQLDHIQLKGGDITLNLKLHNSFSMESCRIQSAQSYGIYAEGFSSRFRNSTIHGCGEAGLYGGAHFNNVVIRDCYFARDRVGVLINGAGGSRIEGCGFEHCPRAAVWLRNAKSFTVNNSYFEGNGKGNDSSNSEHFPPEGPCNTVEVDSNCWGVGVHDNIFRAQLDDAGAFISISDVHGGHIYDNLFWTSSRMVNNGIMLREGTGYGPEDRQTEHRDLIVEHNQAYNLAHLLVEEQPGLVAAAVANGSRFDWGLGQSAIDNQ
jgi:hypothetical protein